VAAVFMLISIAINFLPHWRLLEAEPMKTNMVPAASGGLLQVRQIQPTLVFRLYHTSEIRSNRSIPLLSKFAETIEMASSRHLMGAPQPTWSVDGGMPLSSRDEV